MKNGLFAGKILLWLILTGLLTTAACGTFSPLTRKGGTLLNVEVKTDEPNIEEITESAVKVLQNRLNALGVDGEIRKTLPNRIEIKIYGGAAGVDIPRIKAILLAQSRFELRKVVTPPSPAPLRTFPTRDSVVKELGGSIPANRKILPYSERSETDKSASPGQWLIVENPSIVDGRELRVFSHPDPAEIPSFIGPLLIGEEASEVQLDGIATSGELRRYAYIHLATHGVVDQDVPARSAIILTQTGLPDPLEQVRQRKPVYDGRLLVREIQRSWDLDAELVTLSACDTALGRQAGGEGFVGFTQALLMSGARSVCLSLWKVDDTATALLMQRFEEEL